jgi:CheY-like chemotaxis protein
MGFSESLLERGLVVGEGVDAAETISRNSKHLQHIIDEILDLSKIEAGKLELEIIPTSLLELVEDIRATIDIQARKRGLDFLIDYRFPLPETIKTDSLRIKEILLNLCNNAIKFTPEGSIRLTVDWASDARRLTFSVLDTGIGMTPQQLNKVFNAFAQADSSTTRKFGGTGLGLTICRLLAARLGAQLSVDSTLGQGTRFELSLPQTDTDPRRLLETPDCAQIPGATADQSLPQLRGHVLLTDDSIDNQKLVSMYLEHAGLAVTVASNGEEAVEQALQGDFDLILMDIQMPVMDGLEATATLRDIGDRTPVIALTATAMKADMLRCRQAGCDGFLAKPIDRRCFYMTLSEYLPEASASGEKPGADNGDTEAFLELVKSFISGLPTQLEEMTAAQNGGSWQQLAAAAHKLKGMGGSFGHPELTELAAQLEAAAKRGSAEESEKLVATLRQRVSELITEYSAPGAELAAI